MNAVMMDLALCKGCRKCVDACFVDVIRWDDRQKKPRVAYPEDCVACNACEIACPEACIQVVPTLPGRFPAHY
ncbi:MAG: ferredoxin family protein [Deltaproteobacteria bacterium]|nr:ferredoxin family protein [Deltaproteobacteria bacterium]